MREGDLTYDDFLRRIDIQDVLKDAGYHLNRRDGLRYPSYVRLDGDGRRIRGDKFIVTANGICCFQPPEQKRYNVISFIKEHPQYFSDYRVGMSPDRLVNLVCNRLLHHFTDARATRVLQPLKVSIRKRGKPKRSSILISSSAASTSTHSMRSTSTSSWPPDTVRTT